MPQQDIPIPVRLSDETTTYLDALVAEGKATSRAAALDRVVRRQLRRERAAQDAISYAGEGEDPEWAGAAESALATLQQGNLD